MYQHLEREKGISNDAKIAKKLPFSKQVQERAIWTRCKSEEKGANATLKETRHSHEQHQ